MVITKPSCLFFADTALELDSTIFEFFIAVIKINELIKRNDKKGTTE